MAELDQKQSRGEIQLFNANFAAISSFTVTKRDDVQE
jgi:hypothetical protein